MFAFFSSPCMNQQATRSETVGNAAFSEAETCLECQNSVGGGVIPEMSASLEENPSSPGSPPLYSRDSLL